MTVLTKASILVKKPDIMEAPLVQENICEEKKIDIHPPVTTWAPPKRSAGAMFCLSVTAVVVAIASVTCGLMLYRHYLRTNAVHRYQGFCSVPLTDKQETQVQWQEDPDVQVFTDLMDLVNEEALREKLDIGDSYEKIVVLDNGRKVQFIHDFKANVTSIIDKIRCFAMHLDSAMVLPPARLAVGLERGELFDASRVRSTVRVDLHRPVDLDAALLLDQCQDRPVYMLRQVTGIRKRSAEDPPHDYVQFSGNHVQEIEIENKQEMLEYERSLNKGNRSPRNVIAY